MAKTDAPMTVISPDTAIERLLMAPCTSPSSNAFAVPTACEAVPRESPTAIGSLIPNSLHIYSPMIFPNTPVTMMTATVIVEIPPNSSETPIPIAVVIDFGSSVTYCSWLSPNKYANPKTLPRLDSTPAVIPQKTAQKFYFNNSIC